MPLVCECGREARAGDVECSLCGRDLGTQAPASAWPQTPEPGRPWGPPSPATSGPRPELILIGALILVVVLGLAIFVITRPERTVVAPPAAPAQPTESQILPSEQVPPKEDAPPPSTSLPSGTPSTSLPSDTPSTPEPSEEYSLVDPPLRADEQPDRTKVVRDSAGTACQTSETKTVYGGYPVAYCDLWKPADGLRTGAKAVKGPKRVACQRDVGEDNPTYTRNQSNTWWVWARSSSGTWDWFPETAVKQGASDQPINGIALCHP